MSKCQLCADEGFTTDAEQECEECGAPICNTHSTTNTSPDGFFFVCLYCDDGTGDDL